MVRFDAVEQCRHGGLQCRARRPGRNARAGERHFPLARWHARTSRAGGSGRAGWKWGILHVFHAAGSLFQRQRSRALHRFPHRHQRRSCRCDGPVSGRRRRDRAGRAIRRRDGAGVRLSRDQRARSGGLPREFWRGLAGRLPLHARAPLPADEWRCLGRGGQLDAGPHARIRPCGVDRSRRGG